MRDGVLLTGATGFLGSYTLAEILTKTELTVFALVRAEGDDHAIARLWEGLQLHLPDESVFWDLLPRVVRLRGDLRAPGLGLSPPQRDQVVAEADSVIHAAASLNRKSSRSCFDTNLRGSLYVLQLAQRMAAEGAMQRFTNVSTAAVAGQRSHQVVAEDEAIDWDRSDYDPYARTKKFAELMVREQLPAGSVLTIRPSTVMGDSRQARCWITDMVRATVGLADLPVVPLDPNTRQDIVPGDWVGRAIAALHLRPEVPYDIVHLSAGASSPTGRSLAEALTASGLTMRFEPRLRHAFHAAMRGLDRLPRSAPQQLGAVMKVFWPYITNDVVFDNRRAEELVGRPPPFERVIGPMIRYAKSVGLRNLRQPLQRTFS